MKLKNVVGSLAGSVGIVDDEGGKNLFLNRRMSATALQVMIMGVLKM